MRSNGCLVMERHFTSISIVSWSEYKYMADLLQLTRDAPSDATPPGAVDTGGHPDQRLRFYLVKGIKEGFWIGFSGRAERCSARNMLSARD